MQPGAIRAQISSLNDELKDTVKEVNAYHGERDLLLKQLEELKSEQIKSENRLLEVKDKIFQLQRLLSGWDERISDKQREYELIAKPNLELLEAKEANLKEKIRNLEVKKETLAGIKKELAEAEKNRPLIESVKKELLAMIDNLNEAKSELDIVTRKSERTKEEVDSERKNHLLWMDETKVRIKVELENTDKLRKDWENKHRDLRIITARLKKLWPPKMPFPKIDWI